jgi:asparagine synthase (glutamine-hydrolysing)
MNEAKVAEFLVDAYDEQEESFFEGIYYLPPAHCLLVTSDSVRKWRYWDVDPQRRIRYRHDSEYAEHYLELLTEAVRCRLRSTGPVGISMSGGLDSTSLAALAARLLPEAPVPPGPLKSFSYVFDELVSCDERAYIQPVVDLYGLEATYLRCDDRWTLRDPEQWPVERDYVWSDAYVRLPMAAMAAARQAGCRLLLGGYYGDTLFQGAAFWALDPLREFRWGELAWIVRYAGSHVDWRADVLGHALRQLIPAELRRLYRRVRRRGATGLHPGLHPGFVQRTHLAQRLAENQPWRRFRAPGFGERYRTLTLNVFPQGRAAVRRLYNRHGLELESPYYDRRLVEFVLAVPADQLGRPGWDRWVHRKAMSGLLPEANRLRRQMTDFVPLAKKGLVNKEADGVRAILNRPQIVRREMVRAEWLQQAWHEVTDGPGDWFPLWMCLSLELWMSRYW